MITFWLVCGIFVAISLAFILPPLLQRPGQNEKGDSGRKEANIAVYRDQIIELAADLENGIIGREQYEQDREEIERRLLEDVSVTGNVGAPYAPLPEASERLTEVAKQPVGGRGPVYAIALGIPVIAVALYLWVGTPNAISSSPTAPAVVATGSQSDSEFSRDRMETNVAALAKRLEQNPDDLQGWMMLARSYSSLERYGDASAAYAKATALKADDADLWADYAFALAMANERQLQGQPVELVNKALKLDPENAKALELAGSAAFQAKDYKQAIEYWQRLLPKTPTDSEVGQLLAQRIAEAKTLSNGAR